MVRRYTEKKPKHLSNRVKLNSKHKQMLILGSSILTLVLVIAIFFIWPPFGTGEMNLQPKETPVPTPTPQVKIQEVKKEVEHKKPIRNDIKELYDKNSDTVGYISINETKIDYPVVQSTDNTYYLTRDFEKEQSKKGSIYLDYRCDISEVKHNLVLYGHHMKDGSMFAALKKYKDKNFYDAHRTIIFDTLYEEHKWEVFSVYVTDTKFYYINTDFGNDTEWVEFLKKCQDKSIYESSIELDADDVILTLSTCTYEYDDARLVVQARMID